MEDNNIAQLQGQYFSAHRENSRVISTESKSTTSMVHGLLYRRPHCDIVPKVVGWWTSEPSHATPTDGTNRGNCKIAMMTPFHPPVQYHTFPNQQGGQRNEYCEICRTHGNPPRHFPILHKYSHVPNIVHYEFCGSTTHTMKQCRDLDALADRLDHSVFRVDEAPQGFGGGHQGGGGFRGGRTGGRGPVHCYNYEEQGHLERDCPL
jgi:hypothetical protein